MNKIKKTILTLALLLTAVGGAWAQGPWTSGDCTVTLNNGTLTVSGNGAMDEYADLSDRPWNNYSGDITSVVVESGVTSVGMSAFYSFENMTSVTLPEGLTAINDLAFNGCSSLQSITLPEGLTVIGGSAFAGCGSLQSITIPSTVTSIGSDAFYSCSDLTSVTLPEGLTAIGGTAFASCSSLTSITIPSTVTSIGNMAFLFCSVMSDVYIYAPSLTTYGNTAFQYNASGRKIHVLSDAVDTYKAGWPDYAADIVGDLQPLASGPEVAWNKAEKTGSFTMPGGNVTLVPDYYPQAALAAAPTAINNVPATTDGAIVNAGTVANIGETTTAQGTVMYYVSPTALDDAALQALAADQWTADVPTAAGLAQGQAHVYYYVRGNDSDTDDEIFSDGDILAANALTVTIAAEPTYAVTFADGTEESDKWTASPATDVKKGQTVTVTYTGTKKVIGVKAEKKAKAVPVTAITLNKAATTISAGNTETLSVTAVAPDNATDKTYTWKTSDASIATVDQDGKVTAVALGTVIIYAEANDGSGVKGNCTVTVSKVVTINLSDWGERGQRSFTKDGVTVSAGMIDPVFGELGGDITISTTLGIFTKIVVTGEECYASGAGWRGDESTRTWAGTPASTVSFRGEFVGRDSNPTTIVCTIEPTN